VAAYAGQANRTHQTEIDVFIETSIVHISFSCTMKIYCAGGKIEKNEMGGACGA
jgi:hypothetical protein